MYWPLAAAAARLGIADLRGTKVGREFGEDHGHHSLLPEAGDDLFGRIGEQIRAALAGFRETTGQRTGVVDGIGVSEQKPFAAGGFGAGGDRVVLSGPAWREGARLRSGESYRETIRRSSRVRSVE